MQVLFGLWLAVNAGDMGVENAQLVLGFETPAECERVADALNQAETGEQWFFCDRHEFGS